MNYKSTATQNLFPAMTWLRWLLSTCHCKSLD